METRQIPVLQMVGKMTLTAPDGTDLTPRGKKARAILGLLGTSYDRSRTRRVLLEMLWGARDPENAAASLRQCLSELRRALGQWREILLTEGSTVMLDPDRVIVSFDPPPQPDGGFAERPMLLEGLDVREAAFRVWLSEQRRAYEQQHVVDTLPARIAGETFDNASALPASTRVLILVAPSEAQPRRDLVFADMYAEAIANHIAEIGGAEVGHELPSTLSRSAIPGLRVAVRVMRERGHQNVQVRLTTLAADRTLFSRHRPIEDASRSDLQSAVAVQLLNEAVTRATEYLGDQAREMQRLDCPSLLAYRAMQDIHALDPAVIQEADELFARAYALEPRGIYLAGRALLRDTLLIERITPHPEDVAEEAIAFAREAMELDPWNSTVLGTASKIAVQIENKVHGGLELAKRAVTVNRANVLSWEALATAKARLGLFDEAHRAALQAQKLGAMLHHRYWWDMMCCLTAAVSGRYEEAIRYGEIARDLAPRFRPPLRYLAALYWHRGDRRRAFEHLEALKKLEPDFTYSMLADEDYPIASLRKTPLNAISEVARL
ncbi:MAG: hypothetical protein ACPGID_11835 [Rubricella sp.]